MRTVMVVLLAGTAFALEATLDGEKINVVEGGEDEDEDEEDDLASEYTRHIEDLSVEMHDIKVMNDGEGGVVVVAQSDLEPGHVVARVPKAAVQVRPKGARKMARAVLKESGKLTAVQEHVLLAIKLMHTEGVLHTLSQEKFPLSGLNVSEETMPCLYQDIKSHITTLKEAVSEFANTMVQMELSTHEEAVRALIYALQNGGAVHTTKELGIYPIVELMGGNVFGQVEPGEFTDKGMTYVVNKKVKKGEHLTKAPRLTMFRSSALYGQIDDEIESVPIELSWHAMSADAQKALLDNGCGKGTVATITLEEGYSEMALKCISIAAAYQVEHEEAPTTDYSDRGTWAPEITLAGVDLLNSILTQHIDKVPKDDACYDEDTAIPVLASMNTRIKHILKKASKKITDFGDSYIQVLEKAGLLPEGMIQDAVGDLQDKL